MSHCPYPNEQELQKIREYDFSTPEKLQSFLDYLKAIWHFRDGYYELTGKTVLRLRLSTAGWSGNEDRITALQHSPFWFLFWEKSERGGHYYFKIGKQWLKTK